MTTYVLDSSLTPLGYQQLTSLTSATALTVPAGARLAVLVVEGTGIRWRDDGVSPTASLGMPINPGDAYFTYNGNLSRFSAIQVGAGAVLNVAYYGA